MKWRYVGVGGGNTIQRMKRVHVGIRGTRSMTGKSKKRVGWGAMKVDRL